MADQEQLYRKLTHDKSEAVLSYVGSCLEAEMQGRYDEIQKEMKDTEMPELLNRRLLDIASGFEQGELRRRRLRRMRKLAKVCAVFLIAFVAVNAVLFVSVQAFRDKATEFFFEIHEDFMEVNPGKKDEGNKNDEAAGRELIPAEWGAVKYPEYLPEGFELVSVDGAVQMKMMFFSNGVEEISFYQTEVNKSTSMQVDSEYDEFGRIKINGNDGFWFERFGQTTVIWRKEGLQYELASTIVKESLFKIAERIK